MQQTNNLTPRKVSLKELRDKLLPLCFGWSWAESAIVDLWRLGAIDPQESVCPAKCQPLDCIHIKRWLYPQKFAAWWQEVQARMGFATGAAASYQYNFNNLPRTSRLGVKTNGKR